MASNIPEAAVDVLTKKNKELLRQIAQLEDTLRRSEQERELLRVRSLGAEKTFTKLLLAVQHLAYCVGRKGVTVREARTAREHARKALEGVGVVPPSTLGSSRNRKTYKKKKS